MNNEPGYREENDLESALKGKGQPAGDLPQNCRAFTLPEVERIVSNILATYGIHSKSIHKEGEE